MTLAVWREMGKDGGCLHNSAILLHFYWQILCLLEEQLLCVCVLKPSSFTEAGLCATAPTHFLPSFFFFLFICFWFLSGDISRCPGHPQYWGSMHLPGPGSWVLGGLVWLLCSACSRVSLDCLQRARVLILVKIYFSFSFSWFYLPPFSFYV